MFQVRLWCYKKQIWSTHRVDWGLRRRPQNEDDLKIKDNLKNEDHLKMEDDLKNEDVKKNSGNFLRGVEAGNFVFRSS